MSTDERRPVNRSGQYRNDASRTQGSRSTGTRSGEASRNTERYSGERSTANRSGEYRSSGERRSLDERRASGERRSSGEYRSSNRRSASASKGQKKKSKTTKIVLFAVEIVVLIAMVAILWTVLKTEKVGKMELPKEDIIINEEVKAKLEATSGDADGVSSGTETSNMSGYRNIALFGVDSREGALTKNTRSDTIIIASINEETGDVKLCSVYRDTYLNLSNDTYNKCNAAYAKGGPTQAINMLNMNLDLNITDFVTVGFEGLIDVIDAIGGVEIDVQDSEIVHLNNYQISMVGTTTDGETFTANAGTDYTPVTSAGLQTLNGLQATAYCRIRYVGNDFMRAERQRKVIMAIADKAKANPSKLPAIAEGVFDKVYTSLDLSEIVELLGDVANYQIIDQAGFPLEDKLVCGNIGSKGSCVVPIDLSENVTWVHKFLFGEENYEPSSAVQSYSAKIKEETSPYL